METTSTSSNALAAGDQPPTVQESVTNGGNTTNADGGVLQPTRTGQDDDIAITDQGQTPNESSGAGADAGAGAGDADAGDAAGARSNVITGLTIWQPTSYLFRSQTAAAGAVDIPEMRRLTNDVPARDQISIILGPFVILACDLIIPCIVYYSWLSVHPEEPGYDKDILGYAVIPFGLGEAYILVVRVWRLIRYYDECAPLLSKHKWELDATSWVYGAALLAGLIPFVVGSSLEIPELYLYAPGIYMAFLWSWLILTLLPFKSPVRINSEEAGHRIRPIVFYAAEDFFAVDGWQKRDFRRRFRARYDNSIMFRRMFMELTMWWFAGFMVYLGCLSAVIFNNPFHIAFGLSLGLLFSWIILWSICTYVFIQLALEREREWWIKKKSEDREKA